MRLALAAACAVPTKASQQQAPSSPHLTTEYSVALHAKPLTSTSTSKLVRILEIGPIHFTLTSVISQTTRLKECAHGQRVEIRPFKCLSTSSAATLQGTCVTHPDDKPGRAEHNEPLARVFPVSLAGVQIELASSQTRAGAFNHWKRKRHAEKVQALDRSGLA